MWSDNDDDVCVCAGRLFDFHVLDMVELGIEKYVSLSDIKVRDYFNPESVLFTVPFTH